MNMVVLRATLVALILMVIVQLTHRGRTRQDTPQGKAKRSSQGRTCRPECPACRAEENESVPPLRPAAREKSKSGRPRSLDTNWHFCLNMCCSHYGWVGLGNIVANGHPNGGRWRQLHCTVCSAYFMETTGTIFYRNSLEVETLCRIVQGLAEGWNLYSIACVFKVDPDTVKACLVRAAEHMDAVSNYLIHDLHLIQVQVDELWALVQSWGDEDEKVSTKKQRRQGWVWAGIDSYGCLLSRKLLLVTVVGGRTMMYAQMLIHAISEVLAPGVVPLFLSDQLKHYIAAIVPLTRAPTLGIG